MELKDIMITGSSGTVGTGLMHQLHSAGYEVHGVDSVSNPWDGELDDRTTIADLTDPKEVASLPDDIDMIVHFGANARVHRLVTNPRLAMENIEMTFNILEHARQADISNVIFASSREIYGSNGTIVFSETQTNADRSESPYTASKVSGEALCKSYDTCYDLSTCILRFSNVYGRFDRSDRVVPLFIAQSSLGRPLTVYGSEKVLDFTYLDDCVDGVMRVIEHFPKAKATTFNISSGFGTSLIELAQEIDERTSHESTIDIEPSRTGEVERYVGDITKAQRILGYKPQYSLEEGLERTIEWYDENASILEEIRDRVNRS